MNARLAAVKFALVLALAGAVPGLAQALTFTLKGSANEPPASQGYALDFSVSASFAEYDAIYVYAEPSSTLLLAVVNANGDQVDRIFFEADLLGAKAIVTGDPAASRGRFIVPFRPGPRDQKIRVVLRNEESRILLADARVNPRRFEFSSTVNFGLEKSSGTTFNHCCRSANCGLLCAACGSAYFYCDLANCTETQCL